MKHCIAAAILTLLFTSFVFTQPNANRGLILTGSVVGVKPAFDIENDQVVFDVQLYLQFRNETDSPILIFLSQYFLGTTKIAFLEPSNPESEKSSTVISWKKPSSSSSYDPLPALIRELGAAFPHIDRVTIVQPRSYYETHRTIRATSGYKLEYVDGRKLSEMRAIPEYPGLRIEYSLSAKELGNTDVLENAKRNWKKFGELLLDSSGDYSIKSEVILNKL